MKPNFLITTLLSLSLVLLAVTGLYNGVGLTPAMGYNTWNDFRCADINAVNIRLVADTIFNLGLHKIGYEYVNIDDCWAVKRNALGVIVPDPNSFPEGMKAVADYVHSKGLKFGIYTDRGNLTCAERPGSKGFEVIDALTYAAWGVDYLKEDSCFATDEHEGAFSEYGLMRDALNSTGRPIYFSLCGWNDWYSAPGFSLGNSWRIAGDCNTWSDVLNAIDTNAPLYANARPGGWNDPDMLIGSANGSAVKLTPTQSRTMFSMWSVMAAPLLIGSNILRLSAFDLQTYSNTEVVAVDQDPLGIQGRRLVGGPVKGANEVNVWAKKLTGNRYAVIFLNTDQVKRNITCDSACFKQMGFSQSDQLLVRDLWLHKVVANIPAVTLTIPSVPENGGSVLVVLTKTNPSPLERN